MALKPAKKTKLAKVRLEVPADIYELAQEYAQAERYRDGLLQRLPPFSRVQRTNRRNQTGVVGVYRGVVWHRGRTPYYYYPGTWVDETGRTCSKSFTVGRYGEAKAWKLVRRARREAVARILRERGMQLPGASSPCRRRDRPQPSMETP